MSERQFQPGEVFFRPGDPSETAYRIRRASESNEREALDLNELWLLDRKPFTVSRNHLAIDRSEDGSLIVTDRGSHLGAIVNETHIGGKAPNQSAPLLDGDNVVIL